LGVSSTCGTYHWVVVLVTPPQPDSEYIEP